MPVIRGGALLNIQNAISLVLCGRMHFELYEIILGFSSFFLFNGVTDPIIVKP